MDATLLLAVSAVVLGLAVLVWGADRFVLGASATARIFGLSPLIIGLVIVGFGTSAPEMLVAGLAALEGAPALGIGNALGSNIANIALVLGLTALLWPLRSGSSLLRQELPLLFAATALAGLLMLDGTLGRIEGVLLLLALVATTGILVHQVRRQRDPEDPMAREIVRHGPPQLRCSLGLFWLIAGLMVLLAGSYAVVWGAASIAATLGVSELVIGLTIIAVGTSLPELATGIASALRREPDLLLGNIIGSNLFNTLAVLGLPAVIHPLALDGEVLTRDLPVMALLTIALIAMLAHRPGDAGGINRAEGAILLLAFGGYLALLFTTL